MSIGENIKRLRGEKNITQYQLAESVGVSQSLIAQFERGSKVPNMLMGKEIAKALKCNFESLYADNQPA